MLKNNIITIVIVSVIALFAISGISMYFSYNNTEISLRSEADAQKGKIEGCHDKMWKIISQQAQISEKYKESFDSIYSHIMSTRYSSDDGSLMKWITESNPQFDSSLYKNIMESVEVLRAEFQKYQERMLDIKREHETLCKTYPGTWFISNKSPIEYEVISSSKTKNIMNTGIDNDISVF